MTILAFIGFLTILYFLFALAYGIYAHKIMFGIRRDKFNPDLLMLVENHPFRFGAFMLIWPTHITAFRRMLQNP